MSDETDRSEPFRNFNGETYPGEVVLMQPFEGVKTEALTEDPYLNNANVRLIVGAVTEKLRRAYLFGGSASYPQYKEMLDVKPGDLVVVVDAMRKGVPADTAAQGVGYLLGSREEWAINDEQWAEAQEQMRVSGIEIPERRIERRAFYVQYGPDSVCRWTNCDVIKVVV